MFSIIFSILVYECLWSFKTDVEMHSQALYVESFTSVGALFS